MEQFMEKIKSILELTKLHDHYAMCNLVMPREFFGDVEIRDWYPDYVYYFYVPVFRELDCYLNRHEMEELCCSEDLDEMIEYPDYVYYWYHNNDAIMLYMVPGHSHVFPHIAYYYTRKWTFCFKSNNPYVMCTHTHPMLDEVFKANFDKNKFLAYLKSTDRV